MHCFIHTTNLLISNLHGVDQKSKKLKLHEEILTQKTGKMRQHKSLKTLLRLIFLKRDYDANYHESNRCTTIIKINHLLLPPPLIMGLPKRLHPARLPTCPNLTNITKPRFMTMQMKAGHLNYNNTLAQCSRK